MLYHLYLVQTLQPQGPLLALPATLFATFASLFLRILRVGICRSVFILGTFRGVLFTCKLGEPKMLPNMVHQPLLLALTEDVVLVVVLRINKVMRRLDIIPLTREGHLLKNRFPRRRIVTINLTPDCTISLCCGGFHLTQSHIMSPYEL